MGDIKILNEENKKWWGGKGSKVKKWAIRDNSGHWWLVNGSEFPEKKTKKEEAEISEGYDNTFVYFNFLLGASIGFNIFAILKIIF